MKATKPLLWFRPLIHNTPIDATGDALASKAWQLKCAYLQIREIAEFFYNIFLIGIKSKELGILNLAVEEDFSISGWS